MAATASTSAAAATAIAAASGGPSLATAHVVGLLAPLVSAKLAFSRRWQILEHILLLADGRDKVGKGIQYSARLAVWHLAKQPDHAPSAAAIARLRPIIAMLSSYRKVIRLGRWAESMVEARDLSRDWVGGDRSAYTSLSLINALFGVVSDVFDDVAWCCSFKVLPARFGDIADDIAAFCWWVTIVFDLGFAYQELLALVAKINALRAALGSSCRDISCTDCSLHAASSSGATTTSTPSPASDTDEEQEGQQQKQSKPNKDKAYQQLLELRFKAAMLRLSMLKLLGDLSVATVESFNLKVSPLVVILGSLLSASCGIRKLYVTTDRKLFAATAPAPLKQA